ncbi:MAG TPA: WecB/TagA/CpsF family glycosyltransferase [Phycisphaerae bacterium]|nr:WecB/TagA/CpsF family glycosyltransferase [Phycisphaerae bacterium]HRY70660.1 WecB/TagA/CpsF family glycosyltransferase [Phycisphaerae bacterium]
MGAQVEHECCVSERRTDVLGVEFNLVDYRAVTEEIAAWRNAGRREIVAITNPHSVLLCARDPTMGAATRNAGLVLPDGTGIILAARILGYQHNGRVTGPALMLYLCDKGRELGFRHYFYGGNEGVADQLAERLSERFPGLQVGGTFCPPFRPITEEEDKEIVHRINATLPDIVWVGLGAPKQEKWMLAHHGRIAATAMIGIGAAFDFHSGNVRWAPRWIRKLGIEWAWRLALNPRRMWRRNLDSPIFLCKVIAQRLRGAIAGLKAQRYEP